MFLVNVEEIEIPAPWGHISAKLWGDEKDTPVLVFHGIMDNAGSFDHLIPLLPRQFYYICIDLPGHGLSSHFPAHIPVFSVNHVLAYKLIVDYFKRKRYIIMGHSYGGQIGVMFTQLYPDYVEKLILLDTVTFIPVLVHHFKSFLVERFDTFLTFEEKSKCNNPPTYTYEEALDKLQFGRQVPCTEEAALALSHRALVEAGNGKYMFRVDQRNKNVINPLTDFRYVLESLKENPIRCPILLILGKDSKFLQKYMKDIIKYFKTRRNVVLKVVEGNHDVHNNCAEAVAPHIIKFLLHRKGKL